MQVGCIVIANSDKCENALNPRSEKQLLFKDVIKMFSHVNITVHQFFEIEIVTPPGLRQS